MTSRCIRGLSLIRRPTADAATSFWSNEVIASTTWRESVGSSEDATASRRLKSDGTITLPRSEGVGYRVPASVPKVCPPTSAMPDPTGH